MKFLTDKLMILVLCLIPFIHTEITSYVISGLLLTVAVTCICQVEEKRKTLKLVLETGFGLISVFFPGIAFFSPLSMYEAARTRDWLGAAAIGAGAVRSLFIYKDAYLLPFAVCVLAVYLSLNSAELIKQRGQLIKGRDSSIELERLLKRRNRELKENLEYEVRINTLNERNRIAREIHDNVGHILSRTLLQTGALYAVCPKEQTAVKSGLKDLKENLDTAMESIRKSVHGIRDESLDMRLEIKKITSALKESFHVEIVYDITEELPSKIKLGFVDVLKEAVSNISRHSSGDKVQIIIREHPALYQLIVYDNGNGKPRSGGMGLEDMRQRIEDLGGNFRVSADKGFTVFASVKKGE